MSEIKNLINELYHSKSRSIYATLIRLLGDMDLAEEAMHDAFGVAIEKWEKEGVPDNPFSWIISTGRFKAIDQIRRNKRHLAVLPEIAYQQIERIQPHDWNQDTIADDQLRLIFTCCHPELTPKIQIPLTLRVVCGLTTEEIARAFLVSESTMAQRIVRGKAKIRQNRIPFEIPSKKQLKERLDAVLSVIYLVFNEGYTTSHGDTLTRTELSGESIRLARLVYELLPDEEVMGLLALMLFTESRRVARSDANGDIILLENQNRSLWDKQKIREGMTLIQRIQRSPHVGFYALQAAIAAAHASANSFDKTDWNQIVALYTQMLQVETSPVVELNLAVAISMRDGPAEGLAIVDGILARGDLTNYHLCHATRGEWLSQLGRYREAVGAFKKAQGLTKQTPERRLLQKKIDQLLAE